MKAARGAVVVAARGAEVGDASQAAAHRAGSTLDGVGGGCRRLLSLGACLGAEGDEIGHCDGAGKPRFLRLCPEGDR